MQEFSFPKRRIGLYEKALPDISSAAGFAEPTICARQLGFDYWEISIDESELRLARLNWGREEIRELRQHTWDVDFPIHSMCLSAHRRFPFGSKDSQIRRRARDIMEQAIDLAYELGVRIIQLAGYDVYYEPHNEATHQFFLEGLQNACHMAESAGVILAMEIMDTEYLNSIFKYLKITETVRSPVLRVYPDLGNLFAWNNDLEANLGAGIHETVAIHLKDTLAIRDGFTGKFRDLTIGEGAVDFVAYFKILRRLNYAGPFVIEMWHQGQDMTSCQESLQTALRNIHQAMDNAGYLV